MLTDLKRSVLFTVLSMFVFGGAYHAALWAVGRALFPVQAEGSLLRRPDGTLVGSRLIAQAFTGLAYVHPRPSAVDYNAAAMGGSNHGPSNAEHLQRVQERLGIVIGREGTGAADVPSDMVTASGSGLDPHISASAAHLQVARVAAARAVPVERVRQMVDAHTEPPLLGVFGRARVNVLEVNLALDAAFGAAGAKR